MNLNKLVTSPELLRLAGQEKYYDDEFEYRHVILPKESQNGSDFFSFKIFQDSFNSFLRQKKTIKKETHGDSFGLLSNFFRAISYSIGPQLFSVCGQFWKAMFMNVAFICHCLFKILMFDNLCIYRVAYVSCTCKWCLHVGTGKSSGRARADSADIFVVNSFFKLFLKLCKFFLIICSYFLFFAFSFCSNHTWPFKSCLSIRVWHTRTLQQS